MIIKVFIILSFIINVLPIAYTSPWGILTRDYGIVTPKDIEANTKIADPVDEEGNPFLVWFCIPIDSITTDCEEMYYNDDLGEVGYADSMWIESDGELHQFFTPRVHSYEICNGYEKTWKKLALPGEIACFSGYYLDAKYVDDECEFDKCSYWQIDKMKSEFGYWSYFIDQ